MLPSSQEKALVMFSGGRDSTLAATLLLEKRIRVVLVSYDTGIGSGSSVRDYRTEELSRWNDGGDAVDFRTESTVGLTRILCFQDIVQDILADGVQLIPLGEHLGMFCQSIRLARRLGIDKIASGCSVYQSELPEQIPEVVSWFRDLANSFDIDYLTPVWSYSSAQSVRDELLIRGLNPKSLEGYGPLTDLTQRVSTATALNYLDRRLTLINKLLAD